MAHTDMIAFQTLLLRPEKPGRVEGWAFLILPKAESAKLPRRGRTTVDGTLNDCPFRATLEPDGQLSHWLKVSAALCKAASVQAGDRVTVHMSAVDPEPAPDLPDDLQARLKTSPEALAVWQKTTAIARLDWIHWIDSAKQEKTRQQRIENACDMLSSGKKRVCCFDPSGFYSKSLSPPRAAD